MHLCIPTKGTDKSVPYEKDEDAYREIATDGKAVLAMTV